MSLGQLAALARRREYELWRGDLRAGIIASVIANALCGSPQRRFRPEDFMPGESVSSLTQTPEAMLELFMKGTGCA